MGYEIQTTQSDFGVLHKHTTDILKTCRELASQAQTYGRGGNTSGENWYSWVDTEKLREVSTLREAFEIWGFEVSLNGNGDISYIFYNSKAGQEELFLAAIAPYVNHNSHICWMGEGSEQWRHLFVNGKMFFQEAQIVFSEPKLMNLPWEKETS